MTTSAYHTSFTTPAPGAASRPLIALLLCLLLISSSACSTLQLVPTDGKMVAEVQGSSARLRIYSLPPPQTPAIKDTLVVFVELHNHGQRSLRVSYPDLWMGDGTQRRVSALLPGDILRPSPVLGGRRRLASLGESVFFGRQNIPTRRGPVSMSEEPGSQDMLTPTSRTGALGPFIMRNDYGLGSHLSTDGWPYFGVPRSGASMSLWDILVSTLPDGAILPGGTAQGILFFPSDVQDFAERGLHWDVHDALLDNTIETLSVALRVQ